jgi:hypothetical protein
VTIPRLLFLVAGCILLVEAVGYTVGALRPLRRALALSDPYWNRRLLLNLMLANAGLYLTALYTIVAALIAGISHRAASAVLGITLLACVYSIITVSALTPRDWAHTVFRGVAAILIVIGILVKT